MSAVNDFNKQMVDEFRANHGKLGGMFEGGTMLLLHHNGAKSGTERVEPARLSAPRRWVRGVRFEGRRAHPTPTGTTT